MGLEVPDRSDRIPDVITAPEFINAATYLYIQTFHNGLAGGGLVPSVLVGEMLLLLASGIRH